MPNWLQQVHPVAVLGGLIFIGVAVADHFANGHPAAWSDLDVSFMWAGGAVFGVAAVGRVATNATAAGTAAAIQGVSAAFEPSPSPPAPAPAPATTPPAAADTSTPMPTPMRPFVPAIDVPLASGTDVHP